MLKCILKKKDNNLKWFEKSLFQWRKQQTKENNTKEENEQSQKSYDCGFLAKLNSLVYE